LDHALININSIVGMGWVQGLALSALTYVMLAGSFRSMDASLEECAQVHGMSLFARMRKVTIPLVWPGILAAGLYVLAIGIAAFDVPAIIGMSNRIFTFSTFVFSKALPVDGEPNYGLVGASSGVMLLVALLVSWWYLRVINRANRYAVVTGRGYRPRLIPLGRWWVVGWAFIVLLASLSLFLPLITLL
jgi:iron(III) transport system permease protein